MRRDAWAFQWFYPCQFVCMAALCRNAQAQRPRQAARAFELEDEGLDRWRGMCAILGNEGPRDEAVEQQRPPSPSLLGASFAGQGASCRPTRRQSSAVTPRTGLEHASASGASRRTRGRRCPPSDNVWRV
jgi:hypothetical protein